ncbi:protein ELYS isoform X2 [Malaya genurostris]|uniref:protein ELYS isoform X2 n=1 Tax=Malaya genurostris TaxID=325434 RepID=UPI0026F38318|nr:protein ELYS isoform X2 [Malaya genurostris]
MWSSEISLQLKNVVNIKTDLQESDIGGFLRDGALAWKSKGSYLEVFCTRTGEKQLSYSFDYDIKTKNCTICNVQEMQIEGCSPCLLVVGIQLQHDHGIVIVLNFQRVRILGRIDVNEQLCYVQPICKASYVRGRISSFDECLAIGTASGKVWLVDACLRHNEDLVFGHQLSMNNLQKNQCHIEFSTADVEQTSINHTLVCQRGIYFGLQLETVEEEQVPVTTIVDLTSLKAIAVGYANGQMVIYDLIDLHIIHIAQPPHDNTPIISINLLEPTDDPKACVYVWVFHAGVNGAFAIMHTLMYEEKYGDRRGNVYERFISCSPRLNILCYDKGSFPIGIQSIMKSVSQEEEVLTLCALSWITSDKSTNILVFDLNQWYKAEMPFTCDWRHDLNHTVVFNVKDVATNVCLVKESLIPFSSIHRPEEHFYPNSMSFDILILNNVECSRHHWTGLQNKILENFEQNGSSCLIDPIRFYTVMLRAALVPQFIDSNFSIDASQDIQREFLLSVALEYNCYSLLRQCALNWADGSHLGHDPREGVSLSTLTDWVWSRAKSLKAISNTMCVPLFDLSGRRIDCGTQKMLQHCAKQLRQLSKLYDIILVQCKQYIPDKIYKNLISQAKSVKLAADYQEVVQWLLNVGLLPEGNVDGVNLSDEFLLVPFPYQAIRSYYASQRTMLNDKRPEMGDQRSMEEQSCKYLFIDSFIEREFLGETLKKAWIENNASGVYPPNSMQNLLRSLLIQNINIETKYVLLCYTFMDMTAVMCDGRYGEIVQNLIKFPAVFKLNSAIIKRTQAFWLLDHGNINGAIEELLSPISQTEQYPYWQREFLITALLRYDAPHLALRALRMPGTPLSPFLELKTLLENNLISEAFRLQRSKHDTNLLRCFYEGTLKSSKYEVLLDLALSEEETRILREYLTRTSQPMAENVHFIHLLQKLDFVEAVHMVDKLVKKQPNEMNTEAPKEALNLYHAALEPTTQHLSYLAYAEQRELKPPKKTFTETLSSRLIRGRANFRGRIYHKSIVAIKEAAEPLEHAQPFLEKPGLGIFHFRDQTKSSDVCYPIKFDSKVPKRRPDDDNFACNSEKITSNIFSDFEKPSKRRKLETKTPLSTSFIVPKHLLTEFRPMKPNYNFGNRNTGSEPEKSISRSPSAQLATPVVQKMQPYNPPSPESVSSYTRHGILKSTASLQSFINQKSLSPVAVSSITQNTCDLDEKILRFDLPESPIVEKTQVELTESTKILRPDILNDSILSNDVFFSPDGSILVMDDDSCSDIKRINTDAPNRRPSIHGISRSITPIENNIAIIIEDPDDDSSNKHVQHEVLEDTIEEEKSVSSKQDSVIQLVDLENGKHLPLGSNEQIQNEVLEDKIEEEKHVSSKQDNVVQLVDLKNSKHLPLGRLVLEVNARRSLEVACLNTVNRDVLPAHLIEQDCQNNLKIDESNAGTSHTEEIAVLVSESDDNDEQRTAREYGSTVHLEHATNYPEDQVATDDKEMEDIEILESEAESCFEKCAEEDNSVESFEELYVSRHQIEIDSEVDEDSRNTDPSINVVPMESVINISSSSESNGEEALAVSDIADGTDDPVEDPEKNTNVEHTAYERIMLSAGPSTNTHYVDFYSDTVPEMLMEQHESEKETVKSIETHVSTTTSSTSNTGSLEVRPAVILQEQMSLEDINNVSNQSTKDHQAEDLTIQQEAETRETTPEPSTSRLRNSTLTANERLDPSSMCADIALVSSAREESFSLQKDDKFLGKPKNAHEVDVPAMNLSVKPDEAHEANRKNSKSDESDDAVVLNLSTGPTNEASRNDHLTNNDVSDSQNVKENSVMQIYDRLTSKHSNDSNSLQKTPSKQRRRSTDSGEASTSTPRSNVRTRRMSAMERIGEHQSTPIARHTRASSVAKESPCTPSGKSRRHSSMINLATPESTPLTPRRSKRALSLAKELLTSTPVNRKPQMAETIAIVEPKNVSLEDANNSVVDDSKSDKSVVSTSSRRSTRQFAARRSSMEPEQSTEIALMRPSTSGNTFEEESFAAYTSNRRLTRHQSAIIEKSLDVVRKMSTISEDICHAVLQDDNDSEPESVISNISDVSKRSTRSKTSQKSRAKSQNVRQKTNSGTAGGRSTRSSISKRDSSDIESIDTDQSESPIKKPMLETISEEGGEVIKTGRRRGRSRKN